MPYTINKSDGTPLSVIPDQQFDTTSTSLSLPGPLAPAYGKTFVENLVYLLENFSDSAPPNNPLKGQIWYDTTIEQLKYYDGGQWSPIHNGGFGKTYLTGPGTTIAGNTATNCRDAGATGITITYNNKSTNIGLLLAEGIIVAGFSSETIPVSELPASVQSDCGCCTYDIASAFPYGLYPGFNGAYNATTNTTYNVTQIWNSGSGAPTGSANQWDWYIDGDTGDVYQYLNGQWVYKFNMKGVTGPTGPTGPIGPAHFAYGRDTGSTNVIVIANPIQDVPAYIDGLVVLTLPAANNSGATQIKVESLPLVPVVRSDGSPLQPNDIVANKETMFVFDTSLSSFRIMSATNSPSSIIYWCGWDNGSANDLNVTSVSPSINSIIAGMTFVLFKGAVTNTGPVTISLPIAGVVTKINVLWSDGTPLNGGDWPAYGAGIFVYDGTNFRITGVTSHTSQNTLVHFGADTSSTPNVITANVSPNISQYTNGSLYLLYIQNTVTGPTTINLNGLGAVQVVRNDWDNLHAGDIHGGSIICCSYDGQHMQVIGLNPVYTPTFMTWAYGAPGNYSLTVPGNCYQIKVRLWGAGGGGGGCYGDPSTYVNYGGNGGGYYGNSNVAGSGGGGGEYREGIISVYPGQVINITVGAGGAAGDQTGGGGGNGGYSSFGNYVVAMGGGGGWGGNNIIQYGGVGYGGYGGYGGTIAISGNAGAVPGSINNTPISGSGGPAGLGCGYGPINITTPGGAYQGVFPGGGGNGASGQGGIAGVGSQGLVIIEIL